MIDCSLCHHRPSDRLAWFAATDCPPRGLRTICRACERVARRRPVPDYVFHSARLSEVMDVLARYDWSENDRTLLRKFLN